VHVIVVVVVGPIGVGGTQVAAAPDVVVEVTAVIVIGVLLMI
jgi:hypothetical protein